MTNYKVFAEDEVNLVNIGQDFPEPEANNCFSINIFIGEYHKLQNKERKH